MGNAQDKPPGSGGGGGGCDGGAGTGGRSNQAGGGGGMHRGGGSEGSRSDRSPEEAAAVNGRQSGGGCPAVDTSYLDAPAGALPPHLARLKNEGNHLFKHGQFADALEKYTQAIEGCAQAGEALVRVKSLVMCFNEFR